MVGVLLVSWLAALAVAGCSSSEVEESKTADSETPPTVGGQKVPIMPSARHLDPNESHEPYNSFPATSGPHYPIWWQEWGVVEFEMPDEVAVHNMEHGGVLIRYDCPQGCVELVTQLVAITEQFSKVILSPLSEMDTTIALTAWGYLDKFNDFDSERILGFIDQHLNSPEAPEPLVFP